MEAKGTEKFKGTFNHLRTLRPRPNAASSKDAIVLEHF